MRKLIMTALALPFLVAFVPPTKATAPAPDAMALAATPACADGGTAQDEDCPDVIVFRTENPDGSIDRESCRLKKESVGIVGWSLDFSWEFPFIHVEPVYGIICDYGLCGTIALDDFTPSSPT